MHYPDRSHKVAQRGDRAIYRGKLAPDDSRSYWGETTTPDGARRPVASFWNEGDAYRWLNKAE